LRENISRLHPDAVVSHSALPNIYARIAAPFNTPIIPVLHSAGDDFSNWKYRLIERVLLVRSREVVAVSVPQAAVYSEHFPRASITVIPNGIRDSLPEKGEYATVPTRVVTIARVADQKNPHMWIQVAEELSSLGMDAVWFGPFVEEALEDGRAIVDYAARNARRFPGATSHVGEELVQSDIVFHPSDREAHSVGLLEAAAVGVPIVCSEEVAQSLPPGLPAATFPAGNSIAAVAAIERVANDYAVFASNSRSMRWRVRDAYGSLRTADTYAKLVLAAISCAHGPGVCFRWKS
jgi:glycosyltransferase involved in cell wall biosynthesis